MHDGTYLSYLGLTELETKVLSAQANALEMELARFEKLRSAASKAGERLCALGQRIATLDVLAGLAEVAESTITSPSITKIATVTPIT